MSYNKDTVALAKRMYLNEGRTVESIAQDLGLATTTVKNWKKSGQWEFEEEKSKDAESFAQDSYKFAAFLRSEIERQTRAGIKIDVGQIKMFEILMCRIESVLRLDTELRKAAKKETETDNIPQAVRNMPEVRKALEVIENAVFEYNKKRAKNENRRKDAV